MKTLSQKKIVAIIGIEGGHMTLTHNNSSAWASSAALESSNTSATNLGLSDFGEQAIWDVMNLLQGLLLPHTVQFIIFAHIRET